MNKVAIRVPWTYMHIFVGSRSITEVTLSLWFVLSLKGNICSFSFLWKFILVTMRSEKCRLSSWPVLNGNKNIFIISLIRLFWNIRNTFVLQRISPSFLRAKWASVFIEFRHRNEALSGFWTFDKFAQHKPTVGGNYSPDALCALFSIEPTAINLKKMFHHIHHTVFLRIFVKIDWTKTLTREVVKFNHSRSFVVYQTNS